MNKSEENDYKMDCLARWVINRFRGLECRREFIKKMESSKGKPFSDDLKRRIAIEWEKRKIK